MSTIRRHGVAFHLVPTPGESLWLEVIRDSDGVVLVSTEFDGDDNLDEAVEEWFADIVTRTITDIEVKVCRLCGNRRRPVQTGDDRRVTREFLVEWDYDLCEPCAIRFVRINPWVQTMLEGRYFPDTDDCDDW